MANYQLTEKPRLNAYKRTFQTVTLSEAAKLSITSLAVPLGGAAAFNKAIKTAFGSVPAKSPKTIQNKNGKIRLVQTQADQWFAICEGAASLPKSVLKTAYATNQTHGWVGLDIDGAGARDALERICPINLHPKQFAIGMAARTSMEHLGVIIIRTGDNAYCLLSASSSAESFLHAVETSIEYTQDADIA